MNHNLRKRAASGVRNPSAAKLPIFFAESEIAERLGVSLRTVQSWRARGAGPAFTKFGRLVRYSEAAVEQWLATRPQTGS